MSFGVDIKLVATPESISSRKRPKCDEILVGADQQTARNGVSRTATPSKTPFIRVRILVYHHIENFSIYTSSYKYLDTLQW